jgi:hypothetical protein
LALSDRSPNARPHFCSDWIITDKHFAGSFGSFNLSLVTITL